MTEDYNPLQDLTSQELIRTEGGMTVEVSKVISDSDRDSIWAMLQAGFVDLNRRTYEKQDMTLEEYQADLESNNVLKYVARSADDTPSGYLSVHVGFDDITWTDTTRLSEEQNKLDPTADPYYIGTLVVLPDARRTETAPKLLQAALTHFKQVNTLTGRNSIVFFDCADANYPWLGNFVKNLALPSADFEGVNTTITELYEEFWVKDNVSGEVSIARELPDENAQCTVLDTQHYYGLTLDLTTK